MGACFFSYQDGSGVASPNKMRQSACKKAADAAEQRAAIAATKAEARAVTKTEKAKGKAIATVLKKEEKAIAKAKAKSASSAGRLSSGQYRATA